MSDTPIFDELREAVVEWVEAGPDPKAPDSDYLDRAYYDGNEGTDDTGHPITSLGGSERLSALWENRRRGGA